MVGQVELILGAFAHELQAFGPALDNLIEAEFDGLSALVGTVKNPAVREGSLVVAVHLVRSLGFAAAAFLDYFVHEAAARGFHLGVFGHLGQEFLSLGLGGGAGCGRPLGGFLLQFLVEGFQGGTGLVHGEFQLAAGEHVLQTFEKVVNTVYVDSLLIEAGSHAHSECVRFFIHIN